MANEISEGLALLDKIIERGLEPKQENTYHMPTPRTPRGIVDRRYL